ncbi:MAG TPA: hypothetical protein VMU34_15525 [Mycobacterium sp.]|nr:hypothetical protein [Mycobacterium sp.]
MSVRTILDYDMNGAPLDFDYGLLRQRTAIRLVGLKTLVIEDVSDEQWRACF